jgi:NADH pyrophosphatase NudC (nudix superfamily)
MKLTLLNEIENRSYEAGARRMLFLLMAQATVNEATVTIRSLSKDYRDLGYSDRDLANAVRFLEAHSFIKRAEREDGKTTQAWNVLLAWRDVDQVCWEHGDYMFPTKDEQSFICPGCRRRE